MHAVIVNAEEDLSAGLEPGPDLEVLAEAGQNWDLRLLLNGSVTPNAIRQQYVGKPAGKLSKGQRARLNKRRRKVQMTQGAELAMPLSRGYSVIGLRPISVETTSYVGW